MICALGHPLVPFVFKGPWFRSNEAAAYVGCQHRCGCPSIKGFWNWRQRHGVTSHRGRVLKADLDAALLSSPRNSAAKECA